MQCSKHLLYFIIFLLGLNSCQINDHQSTTTNDNSITSFNISSNTLKNIWQNIMDKITDEPDFNGAVLTIANLPPINTQQSTIGILQIVNAGNYPASLSTISYPTGVTATTGSNACGTTLNSYASCNLYFTVPMYNGSGTVIINYLGGADGQLTQNISWYNGKGNGLLLQISANPSSLNISGVTTAVVNVTNVGAYPLTNIVTSVTVASGNATANISNDSCSNTSLAVNASCSYTINANDFTTEASKALVT